MADIYSPAVSRWSPNINVGCLLRWKICNVLNFSSSFSKNLTTSNWMKKRMNEKVYSKSPRCPSFVSIYLIKDVKAYFIISRTIIWLELQCFNCEQNRSNIFIIGQQPVSDKESTAPKWQPTPDPPAGPSQRKKLYESFINLGHKKIQHNQMNYMIHVMRLPDAKTFLKIESSLPSNPPALTHHLN